MPGLILLSLLHFNLLIFVLSKAKEKRSGGGRMQGFLLYCFYRGKIILLNTSMLYFIVIITFNLLILCIFGTERGTRGGGRIEEREEKISFCSNRE